MEKKVNLITKEILFIAETSRWNSKQFRFLSDCSDEPVPIQSVFRIFMVVTKYGAKLPGQTFDYQLDPSTL